MEQDQATSKTSMDVRGICKNMMTTLPICHLTTVDTQGYPQTTAMLNLRCAHEYPSIVELYEQAENPFLLYMTTSNQSNKMARLLANPKVSVYFCDPLQIVGFMLSGDIEVITDRAIKDSIWQEGWTMYYPNGPKGLEYGVIKLMPRMVKGWCRNQAFEFKP
jgi:general stress protein 26